MPDAHGFPYQYTFNGLLSLALLFALALGNAPILVEGYPGTIRCNELEARDLLFHV